MAAANLEAPGLVALKENDAQRPRRQRRSQRAQPGMEGPHAQRLPKLFLRVRMPRGSRERRLGPSFHSGARAEAAVSGEKTRTTSAS